MISRLDFGWLLLCVLLASSCDIPPRVSPTLRRVKDHVYGVGFVPCRGEWPIPVTSIKVYRIEREHELLDCAVYYNYSGGDLVDKLSSDEVWVYGSRLNMYDVSGKCNPIMRGGVYRVESYHLSVGPVEKTVLRIHGDGGVEVVSRKCDSD